MGLAGALEGVACMQPNIRALRWMAIVVPAVGLGILDLLRHTIFHDHLHTLPGFLSTYLAIAAGAAIFSVTVFGFIERLQATVLEQNQEMDDLNTRLQRQNTELSALLDIGQVATSSFAEDDLLNRLLDTVLTVVPGDTAEVWLVDPDEGLSLRCVRGPFQDRFREITHFPAGTGLPGEAVRTRQPVLVDRVCRDPRFRRQSVVHAGFQSYCALPLLYRNRPVGVLAVASLSADSAPDPEDLRLLEAAGGWLALAIENARLYHKEQDTAVIEERERISREMHDGMAQVLGYINTQTLAIKRHLSNRDAEAAMDDLNRMEEVARELYGDIREGMIGLRTAAASQDSMIHALSEYAEQFTAMCDIQVKIREPASEILRIDPHAELQLIRIVQEALTNVRKHASATFVTIELLVEEGTLHVSVQDNGSGFEPEALPATGSPRFGLQTMRERAEAVGGTLSVQSNPDRGTTVTVRLPTNRLEFL
jgi:signal transduction histidine kinase